MKRRIAVIITAIAAIAYAGASPALATDTVHKAFVCKYVGTPGVDERLQTGQNPIDVDFSAIGESPVVVGSFFADDQGRSYVLALDIGQADPDVSLCPPPEGPPPSPTPVPPTPTPTPIVTPSPVPSTPPSESPSEPPNIGTFSIATCPAGVEVPVGESAISIRGSVLLILLLHVRVDGELITLQDALGDGSVGDAFVTPGAHVITISNAADDEVLFTETVDCPVCRDVFEGSPTPSVPPAAPKTAPPSDIDGTTASTTGGASPLLFLILGVIGAGALLTTRKRRA
jgi:hypothetical protein